MFERGVHNIMANDIVNELLKGKKFWRITPPKEKLLEKIIGLKEEIKKYRPSELDDKQKHILQTCEDYIRIAEELIKARFFSHPHLVWNLLHRVDERIILLMPEHELAARVVDVKAAFDLNIKEEPVRKEWLGDKGKLTAAIHDIAEGGKNNIDKSRYAVKEALQYVDDFVDLGFWKLSINILISVSSALLLAGVMLVYYFVPDLRIGISATSTKPICFAVLGLMGGYLSNLLTKEDFLFVWGGPFFRYLFYNLMARPIIGAFSAVFFYLVEKSKLIFSLNPISATAKTAGLPSVLTINVSSDVRYVYIVFAIAVGFAGEKALRGMMDKVLRRLEEKAEKTKETSPMKKKDEKKD